MPKNLTYNLVIVSTIEPIDEGVTFKSSDWPLHLTIVPVFTIKVDLNAFINDLTSIASQFKPILISADEEAMFGPNHDRRVTLVHKSLELQKFHDAIINLLKKHNATFNKSNYILSGYRPHITAQHNSYFDNEQRCKLSHINLVDRCPDGDAGKRRIICNIKIGK